MKVLKYIALALLTASLSSCGSDYLETEDTQKLNSEQAAEVAGHNSDVFLNGMWSYMADNYTGDHDAFNFMSVMLSTDMMTQNIAINAFHYFGYDYAFDYRMAPWSRTSVDWTTFYTLVSKANKVISLYPNRSELTDAQKAFLGQAFAMRGMSYYYLIQLYQDPVKADGTVNTEAKGVPLIYTEADGKTAEEIDAAKGRNTLGEVYAQIENDLTTAVSLLGTSDYERPNKDYIDVNVAEGLLARYYLLSQQWQKAADAAKLAHTGYDIMGESGLHDGFMNIDNVEWMWGFDESSETTTTYASFFSHISNIAPGYSGLGLCTKLIDAELYNSIPADDYRKSLFNGPEGDAKQKTNGAKLPYANLKFGNDGNWTMDYPYMRAAEMILIEAEAYAHLGEGTKAAEVLKELMVKRQPSWDKTSVSVEDVYLQRRIELWGEGFGFFDLKRLGKGIDRNYEGTNHLPTYRLTIPAHAKDWTYQIPRTEMQENKHLAASDQND